jgi:hypothetical protein
LLKKKPRGTSTSSWWHIFIEENTLNPAEPKGWLHTRKSCQQSDTQFTLVFDLENKVFTISKLCTN